MRETNGIGRISALFRWSALSLSAFALVSVSPSVACADPGSHALQYLSSIHPVMAPEKDVEISLDISSVQQNKPNVIGKFVGVTAPCEIRLSMEYQTSGVGWTVKRREKQRGQCGDGNAVPQFTWSILQNFVGKTILRMETVLEIVDFKESENQVELFFHPSAGLLCFISETDGGTSQCDPTKPNKSVVDKAASKIYIVNAKIDKEKNYISELGMNQIGPNGDYVSARVYEYSFLVRFQWNDLTGGPFPSFAEFHYGYNAILSLLNGERHEKWSLVNMEKTRAD